MKDPRIAAYKYWDIFKNHVDLKDIFTGKLIYPRQFEIHLPANHKTPCMFKCEGCAGSIVNQPLEPYEPIALSLLRKLNGAIPFNIFGGLYTEPLMNKYLLEFLKVTKETGSYFGIHCNGALLLAKERNEGFLTKMCQYTQNPQDYLSVSLDAGCTKSHKRGKGLTYDWFTQIIKGIRLLRKIRGKQGLSIRICYLLNDYNSSQEELNTMVRLAKDLDVNSLRFSIPFAMYGVDLKQVKEYRDTIEVKKNIEYINKLDKLVSKNLNESPYIFYLPPSYQDVLVTEKFKECVYGLYQVTLASDGNLYRCSSVASPSFVYPKMDKLTDNVEHFNSQVIRGQTKEFNPKGCFACGGRANRMGLEINNEWMKLNEK